jgi:hypothetical protein
MLLSVFLRESGVNRAIDIQWARHVYDILYPPAIPCRSRIRPVAAVIPCPGDAHEKEGVNRAASIRDFLVCEAVPGKGDWMDLGVDLNPDVSGRT